VEIFNVSVAYLLTHVLKKMASPEPLKVSEEREAQPSSSATPIEDVLKNKIKANMKALLREAIADSMQDITLKTLTATIQAKVESAVKEAMEDQLKDYEIRKK